MNVKLWEIFTIVTSIRLLVATKASMYPITTVFAKGDKCISSDGDSGAGILVMPIRNRAFFQVTQRRYIENQLTNVAALKQALANLGIGRN